MKTTNRRAATLFFFWVVFFCFLLAALLCVLNRRNVATDRRSGSGIFPGRARARPKSIHRYPHHPSMHICLVGCVSESERSERLAYNDHSIKSPPPATTRTIILNVPLAIFFCYVYASSYPRRRTVLLACTLHTCTSTYIIRSLYFSSFVTWFCCTYCCVWYTIILLLCSCSYSYYSRIEGI